MQLSLESMEKRISVRSYDGRPLGAKEAEAIRAAFDECAPGPFGGRPRFLLLGQGEAGLGGGSGAGGGARIGSYGFIKAAPAFIIGAIAGGPFANEDYGYCLEGIVLRATELGLGTCWLGGSFSRGKASAAVALGADEIMPCISPIGFAGEKRSLIERVVRSSAKGDNRKPAAELFFDGDFRTPLESAGNYDEVLEAVRRAPSASNKQPWRILRAGATGDRVFHLYLAEDRIYNSALGAVKMQDVDMGIAMRHFEVAARSLGLPGAWRRLDADPLLGNSPFGYIATWQA